MRSSVTTEHRKGQAKIFDNPFLESLTRTNPATSIVVYGFTISFFVYMALAVIKMPLTIFFILFLIAFLFWTLVEYLLHRYIFHWVSENKFIKRFHFVMHGSHHLYPKDSERLLMPPIPGLLIGSLLFAIQYTLFYVFGFENYTWGFFAGFFLGYLLYSFLHRAIHVYRAPKGLEFIWHHHIIHHYKHPDKAFGVSNTIWDRFFGTMPPKKLNKQLYK